MTGLFFVTGASSGFGAHVSARMAARGHHVVASMRDTAKVDYLNTLLDRYGADRQYVDIIELDVRSPQSRAAAVDYLSDSEHQLETILHCAGYTTSGFFEDLAPDSVRDQFETNFFGAVELTRLLLPQLRSRKGGTVAMITSNAVNVPHPMYSIYSASKWALEGWAEALSMELAPFGIRVLILQPGNHDTSFGNNVVPVSSSESAYSQLYTTAIAGLTALGGRARSTDKAAAQICAALDSPSSPLRVRIGFDDKLMAALARWAPHSARRRIVERITGLTRTG